MYQRKTQRIWNGWQPPTSNPLSSSLVQEPPVPNPLSFSLVQEGLRKILDAHTDFTAGQCCSLSEHHPARRRTADDASATEGGACQRSGRRCVRRRRRRGAQPLSRTKSGAQWRTKSGAQRAIAPWDAAHGAGGGSTPAAAGWRPTSGSTVSVSRKRYPMPVPSGGASASLRGVHAACRPRIAPRAS